MMMDNGRILSFVSDARCVHAANKLLSSDAKLRIFVFLIEVIHGYI